MSPEEPEPPEDVRVEDTAGNSWPCTVAYQGRSEDGIAQFVATPLAWPRTARVHTTRIRRLPPRTEVIVHVPVAD